MTLRLQVSRLFLLAVALTACATSVNAAPPVEPAGSTSSWVTGELQEHQAGMVTVSAEWIAGTSALDIGLNTHSVDVDAFDLGQSARVRLDGGSWIAPTAWNAPTGGQHHRSGTLSFDSIDPKTLAAARSIELEIRDATVTHLLRWTR